MNRKSLFSFLKNNQAEFKDESSVLDLVICDEEKVNTDTVDIKIDNSALNLLIYKNLKIKNINIELLNAASLHIAYFDDSDIENSVNINANVSENSSITVYFADFSRNEHHNNILINLNGKGANALCHVASLTRENDRKVFNTSIYHNSIETNGNSINYGVCKGNGRLSFEGVSKIVKGASRSKTNQAAKIIVFDKDSISIARPILKIDENDVVASHSATVGQVNENELFYLTSRGLSDVLARELITIGYLKPITNGFKDEEIIELIMKNIEGDN